MGAFGGQTYQQHCNHGILSTHNHLSFKCKYTIASKPTHAHTQKHMQVHTNSRTRAISFMSVRGKRIKRACHCYRCAHCKCQWAGTQEYLIVEHTLCNSPFTMYGLSAGELLLGNRRTKEKVIGSVCSLSWWHWGTSMPLKSWDCRWHHRGCILMCSRWINPCGGWGKSVWVCECVCDCVCKSGVLMLFSFSGSRHAWLCVCVFVEVRVCVCVCASVIKVEENQCVRWSVCSWQSSSHTLPKAISLADCGTSCFFSQSPTC